jgi:hypothetical protein
MKIKKIISLCKTAGQLILYSDPERDIQWLSDGRAIYPLIGCPKFDEDSFCNTYEITDSQRKKIAFRIDEPLPLHFNFDDTDDYETETERMPLSVTYSAYDAVALKTQYGIEFINRAHIHPFGDYSVRDIIFTLRTDETGNTYFAVKCGFMLIGIVLPLKIIVKSFIDDLKNFERQVEVTFYNSKSENPQLEMPEVNTDDEED